MLLDFCGFLYCIFVLHPSSLRPCILSTRSIQYAYISSVLTVSFNGIRQTNKQIKQLYQFLHIVIKFHWFHHFNYFWLKPSIPQFPCPQFNHSNQYCTFYSISVVLPKPTVLSIPSMLLGKVPKKNGFVWDFVPNIGPHPPNARVWDSTKWKIKVYVDNKVCLTNSHSP